MFNKCCFLHAMVKSIWWGPPLNGDFIFLNSRNADAMVNRMGQPGFLWALFLVAAGGM
jgi:hypothetical protein